MDSFLFWRETHTKGLLTRLEENEERESSRAVNREKLATVGKRQRSEREAAVEGGVGTFGSRGWVGQRERMSQRSW